MKQKLFSMLALLLMAATGAVAQTTYTVVGNNSAMFGSAWDADATANDMTKNGDGTYSITYTNVYLDEEVQYKVVKDHDWGEAYPDDNRVINIAKAGTYTVTIHFNPTTHEVYETMPYTVTLAEGTEDAGNWTITPKQGLSEGDQVTITYNGTKRVKNVTAVKKASTIPVTAITLNKTETSIKVGSTETLSVTAVAPEEATDKTYTWKTSDASKATVDQDGKVTAVAEGTVNIYAEANDGSGVKGNCTVTVTSAAPEYYNKLTKINDNSGDQEDKLKDLGRGFEAYNSSLTDAQAYALATYQAAIDGKPVYVIMSSRGGGYEIHYALSTDAEATEHTADLFDICNGSNPVRMYYVAQ